MATITTLIAMTALTAATPAARAPALLLPVGDGDTRVVEGAGCESSFVVGNTSYTFMRNSDLLLRTAPGRAGLHLCALTNDQTEGFGEGPRQVACGSRRLTIRPAGRARGDSEADSVQYPAVLTVTDGRRTITMRGSYGTAC